MTKNTHLDYSDRQIIEKGIFNGSNKVSIANNIGKDPTTIAKEIRLHRIISYKCRLPLECAVYRKCK